MSRVGRWLTAPVGLVLTAALAAGCTTATNPTLTALPSTTGAAGFGPGTTGVGDPYYPEAGNGGYDVASYDLAVTYDPATDELTGVATITATSTQNLSRFNLDFEGLTIDELTVDGVAAAFERDGAELVVTPSAGVAQGASFVTRVAYHGVPATSRDNLGDVGVLHNDDGVVVIGEPEVAAYWFPVNDHPRDKATYTIAITAPNGLEALSNGVLRSREPATEGWTTWTWAESRPMAPYLATMVIGEYRLQESTHDGLPVIIAVDTSLPTSIDDELARTPEIVDYLEGVFGPYPFDALGGIVVDDRRIRFALENQSRPIYSWAFFGGGDASWVVAHELAHQWYGDSVSVQSWSDLWLNEGFATYAEWLWDEHEGGRTPQEWFDVYFEDPASPMWRVPPADPGTANLFHDSVYIRGGMTLQALRVKVGDDDFFEIVRSWAAQKADGNATTAEFIAHAEKVSGDDLDTLFQEWLYGTERPPHP